MSDWVLRNRIESRLGPILLLGIMVALVATATVMFQFVGLGLAVALPLTILALGLLVKFPEYSLHLTVVVGFLATGASRYVSAPTGLAVDALLAVGVLVALFKRSEMKEGPSGWLPVLFTAWMGLTILELANPVGGHPIAWLYAMRGVALYPLLILLIGYLLKPGEQFLQRFLLLWAGLSVLGSLWGLKQLIVGLDPFEMAWLSVPGNYSTHLLFGKLRVFSFYSDSGQFGAAQGHMLVVAGILALGKHRPSVRIAWAAVAALSLIGLLISGTRGAMAVPAIGGIVYLVLCRNWKLLFVGFALLGSVYGVLRFTYVGQNIYEVRRMRTAIVEGSDNASFQVRIVNQKRLAAYLSNKPFGGGVGSAGYWGKRFTPGTFLADLALDSWYVKIWAEYGIVGLTVYALMLAWIVILALRTLARTTDMAHRQVLLALFAGFAGILVASYGNQVFGQLPTGIVVPISLLYLVKAPLQDD